MYLLRDSRRSRGRRKVPLGETPITGRRVEEGGYRLVFAPEGDARVSRKIEVSADGVIRCNALLETGRVECR